MPSGCRRRAPTSSPWTSLEDYPSVPYPMASSDDLAETVALVEALGRRIVASRVDVREPESLGAAVDEGVARPGPPRHRERQCRHLHRPDLGRGQPGDLEGHPRHQPDRRVEHHGLRRTAPDRQRWRIDHRHQLGGGDQGTPLPGPLCGLQARRGRDRPVPGPRAGPAPHQGQHRPPDRGDHTDAGRDWAASSPSSTSIPTSGGSSTTPFRSQPSAARDVSEAVLFLASDDSRYVTGLEFTIDAGATIR